MARVRVRPAHSPEELARIYARPHDHWKHPDHWLRVEHTISLAKQLMWQSGETVGEFTVADLACGDAAIPRALCPDPVLGDLAPGYNFHGPIEETIELIGPVRLFVFCEIMEHLDDPDKVLRQIHQKTDALVLSTPIEEDPGDAHEEHYWSWDMTDVRDMLHAAGWKEIIYGSDVLPQARFQYWGCWHR